MSSPNQPQLNGAYYGPSIPPPKTYHRPGRGRGCNPFSCLCGCLFNCIFQIIISIVVVIGIIVLVFWLIFHPDLPKLHVTEATLTQFSLSTNNNNDTLLYNLSLNMTFRNPNKRIGIYYDYIEVDPYYQGERFGFQELTPFYLGHKSENEVVAAFEGQQFLGLSSKDLSNYNSDKNSGVYGIDVKLHLKIRFKLGWSKTGTFKPEVECDLKVPLNANGTVSSTTFQPKKCHFDL